MWRIPACQTLSKALEISSPAAQVARYLFKALVILSDATVRRSAVDWEDLKGDWGDQRSYYLNTLLTTEQRLNRLQYLAVDLSATFLNTGPTYETFQLIESSASL